jgi:hypothetical protein
LVLVPQVAQVLLTLPYSFSQLGMLSGVLLQIFYGFLGSWTAYLISVLYVEYRSRKEKEGVSFKNHVIQVWLSSSSSSSVPAPLSPPRHTMCNTPTDYSFVPFHPGSGFCHENRSFFWGRWVPYFRSVVIDPPCLRKLRPFV